MKKVLILTTTCGNGHNSAAKTLKEEIVDKLKYEAVIFDPIKEYSSEARSTILSKTYPFLIRFWVGIYNVFYNIFKKKSVENEKKVAKGKELNNNTSLYVTTKDFEKKLYKKIQKEKPDIIIATYFVCSAALSNIKKEYKEDYLTLTMSLDYAICPGLEYSSNLDLMFITGEYMRQKYLNLGFKNESLIPAGVPVRRVFSDNTWNKESAREFLKLDNSKKVLTILQAGFCPYTPKQIIKELSEMPKDVLENTQFVFVCGRESKILVQTRKWVKKFRLKNVKIYGFLNNIEVVFKASDLVMTKGGGLSTTELINSSTPVAIFDKLPVNEMENRKYLVDNGCAIEVNGLEDITDKVAVLIRNDFRLEQMREACKNIQNLKTLDIMISEIKKRVE